MLTKEQIMKLDDSSLLDEDVQLVPVDPDEWDCISASVMADYALEMEILK